MSRVKTFQATGLAPDGRLYAGDLNNIQDHYADLVNFSQTFGAGVVAIGDIGMQILKYGTAEFRMTGAVRTDGILRALGGIYTGAFTTAQRDAIPLGFRPYGLIILNTSLGRFEWNAGTDGTPNWQALFDSSLLPTIGEKQALAGNAGAPSSSNKYITEQGLSAALGGGIVAGSAAGGDLADTYPNPRVRRVSKEFALIGILSPGTLSATQNNYSPANLADASVLRVASSTAISITGLAGGATGRLMKIINVGGNTITLKDEDAGSSASNRFALNGDIALGADHVAEIWYDTTSARWRASATTAPTGLGGGGLANYKEATLQSNVMLYNGSTWYDGPTITLESGIWLVNAHVHAIGGGDPDTVAGVHWAARINDGSNTYAGGLFEPNADSPGQISLTAIVSVATSKTVKAQVARASQFYNHNEDANQSVTEPGIIYAATKSGGSLDPPSTGNNASKINAVKVG